MVANPETMRRHSTALVWITALGVAGVASAAERGPYGALRLQLGLPHGQVEDRGVSEAFFVDHWVAPELHLGWRLSEYLVVAAYVSLGAAVPASPCPRFSECSADGARYGLLAQVELTPRWAGGVIWASLGTGFAEIGHRRDTSVPSTPPEQFQVRYSGREIFNVAGGFDLRVVPHLRVGPFVGAAFSQFDREDLSINGSHPWRLLKPGWQGWLLLGLRVTLDYARIEPDPGGPVSKVPRTPAEHYDLAVAATSGLDRLEQMHRGELVRARLTQIVMHADAALAALRPGERYATRDGTLGDVELRRRLEGLKRDATARLAAIEQTRGRAE